jgi:hypothetical protein
MPKFSVTGKAEETRSGFEPYDGVEPSKPGMYRSVLKKLLVREYGTGSVALRGLFELEAQKGDPKKHAQFDGTPKWGNVFFVVNGSGTLKDGTQRALNNFLAGLGVTKANPDIVTDADGDTTKGAQVKSIGGKAIATMEGNKAFSIDLRNDGEYGLQISNIYPAKDVTFDETDEDEEETDVEVETEDEEAEEEEEGQSAEERQEELEAMTLAALRKLAKSLEIDTTGLKKDALVEAVLDAEFGEAVDEAEPDEDEPEEEEEDAEEEEDDEAEEEEDEAEEEEEAEDDGSDERRAELAELKRPALLKLVKEVNKDFRPLKRHSDEDLVEAIIAAEFGSDTPF